jgi:hypothetical protein
VPPSFDPTFVAVTGKFIRRQSNPRNPFWRI